MGTNPMAIGIPTDEEFPFVIDGAMSIIQRGTIEILSRNSEPAEPGWVINEQGETMTDSTDILKALLEGRAAFLPLGGADETFGGHKGYGYAAVVEILSAALWGGPFMKDLDLNRDHRLGHFLVAIDVKSFIEPDTFKKVAGDICRALRSSKRAADRDRIYTAGEKEYETEQRRRREGIPISRSIQKDLLTMKHEMGLTQYAFKF